MDQTVLQLDSLIDVWQKQDFFSIAKHARSAPQDITLMYQEKFQRSVDLFHQLFCNNTAHLQLQDINVITKYFFPFFASRRKISIRDTTKVLQQEIHGCIQNGAFLQKQQLLAINVLVKKLHHGYSTRISFGKTKIVKRAVLPPCSCNKMNQNE